MANEQNRPTITGPTIDPMKAKIMAALKDIKHVLIVASGKGGVGKTTVAINLATALANKKYKVGILDADITGPNVPKMVGLEGQRPNIDSEIKKKVETLAKPYPKRAKSGDDCDQQDSDGATPIRTLQSNSNLKQRGKVE